MPDGGDRAEREPDAPGDPNDSGPALDGTVGQALPTVPASVPQTVPEAVGFRFDGVSQVGGVDPGPGGAADRSLFFDQLGVDITGPPRGEHHLVPWTTVTRVSLGVTEADPDGGFATPIEIESVADVTRFLIPSEHLQSVQIAALDHHLATWSGSGTRPLPAPPPSAPSPLGSRADGSVWPVPFGSASCAPGPYSSASYPPVSYGDPRTSDGGLPGAHDPPAVKPKRTRRKATLVLALALLVAGVGLAFGLSAGGPVQRAAIRVAPRLSPDQQLVNQLMLTRSDLPHGWTVNTNTAGSGSQKMQNAEIAVTRAFARCMGITDQQGAIVLGGQATDQTAQTASPIFVAPTSGAPAGFALELQTAASIVRTHLDEQSDFALYANPQYPQCAATAVASELQLGANNASGHNGQPGPATASVLHLPAPAGEQLSGLLMTFTVSDGSASVPVEVEAVSLGTDRIEAALQAFAIGGRIPTGVLAGSLSAFEQRVAGDGKSAVV